MNIVKKGIKLKVSGKIGFGITFESEIISLEEEIGQESNNVGNYKTCLTTYRMVDKKVKFIRIKIFNIDIKLGEYFQWVEPSA